MNLSKRLAAIRALSQEVHSIWDIGCDHGLLGLSFINDSGIQSINLVDPSISVIGELRSKIIDAYITIPDLIKIHHKKGQEILLNPENKTIFIAGMGGKEIIEIMDHLQPQLTLHDRLIISPHRKILEVRQWLMNSSLGPIKEELIHEDGQFYPIFALAKDSSLGKVSPYGEAIWENKLGQEYRDHQIAAFSRHEDRASRDFVKYLKSRIPTN